MSTIFEELSDASYTAFFEVDPDKRRAAIDAWSESAIPVIQAAVGDDLKAFLERALRDRQTEVGWQEGVNKFRGILNDYRLTLDVSLRPFNHRDNPVVVNPLDPITRQNTMDAVSRALEFIAVHKKEQDQERESATTANRSESVDDDGSEESGRSSNDDRSDSMNPNNSAYTASMDNRSDQLNPNNSAYHSSRGHR